jgi:integrase/recombinase XerD
MELVRKWQGSRAPGEPIIGLQTRQLHRIVREYGLQTGLVQKYEAMMRSFSPHSLRHAFATHRHDAGMDLAVLQKLLGHRYLTTTMIYVQTSMRDASKQYRKSDPLRGE